MLSMGTDCLVLVAKKKDANHNDFEVTLTNESDSWRCIIRGPQAEQAFPFANKHCIYINPEGHTCVEYSNQK